MLKERVAVGQTLRVIGNGSISGIDLLRWNKWYLKRLKKWEQVTQDATFKIVCLGRISADKGSHDIGVFANWASSQIRCSLQ